MGSVSRETYFRILAAARKSAGGGGGTPTCFRADDVWRRDASPRCTVADEQMRPIYNSP